VTSGPTLYWGILLSHNRRVGVMKLTKSIGMLLLGIWLILTGLAGVIAIPIPALGIILAVLAIAAGALILLGR
jgi:hypothetical protein